MLKRRTVHRRRSTSPARQRMWSRTIIIPTALVAATPQRFNLMTTLDGFAGLFVNKGYTCVRFQGYVESMITDGSAFTAGQAATFHWGIVAADPNLSVASMDPAAAGSLNLRWLHTDGHSAVASGVAQTLMAQPDSLHFRWDFDTRVNYKFTDENTDLWFIASSVNKNADVMARINVLLLAP